MSYVRVTEMRVIDAPPERVYAYRLDFTTLAEYNPSVSNVRQTKGDGPGPGAEYLFDLSLEGAPAPLETPLRVLAATEPSRIDIETGPGYIAREVCTFEPAGSGTRVTFEQTIVFEGELPAEARDAIAATTRAQTRAELEMLEKILAG